MGGELFQVVQAVIALALLATSAAALAWFVRPNQLPGHGEPSPDSPGILDHRVIEEGRQRRDFHIPGPVQRKARRWTL